MFFLDKCLTLSCFRSKLVKEKYCPPLICLNPGMQFFVRTKYEKAPPVKIIKEKLSLSDGGVVAFDRITIDKGNLLEYLSIKDNYKI